ncbi:hypothetical protein [Virgibacillus senegalensis]|uniref:hypothetical protein n=1 Tax=Virgibacillus senegalensis TaxID=1499679 RepID=UPI00069DB9BB|nr:hypothetical protein [Virgibacillus senegalensis]
MYRRILVVLLILIVFLTSCNTNTFTYSGESENWSADLRVTQTSDDYQTQDFRLVYKGSDVDAVGEVSYLVESMGSFGRSGVLLEENGTLTDSDEANPTNAKVTEYTEVEVTVEWNDNVETFVLSKQ